MLKKLYAVLVLFVFAQASFAAWDGTGKIPKTVTVGDTLYYEITSPEELIGYLDSVLPVPGENYNLNGYLKNDMVFGADTATLCEKVWQRVGASLFLSTFDGRGHTIYGLNATNSLLHRIGQSDGVVRNLNIANSSFGSDTTMEVAAVADIAHTLIENVNVRNTNVRGYVYAGGIVAYVVRYQDTDNANILNCNVEGGSVSSYSYAGGISAYVMGRIKNCSNSAKVSLVPFESDPHPDVTRHLGGIVAYITVNGGLAVENCKNSGDLDADQVAYVTYAGGVVGYGEGGMSNLENDGDVVLKMNSPTDVLTSYQEFGYAGGVAGSLTYYKLADETHNLVNHGNVSATVNSAIEKGGLLVGGVVGRLYKMGTSNLVNTGKVEARGYGQFMRVQVGGVVGFGFLNSGVDRFSRFMNSGDVVVEGTFETYAGGVLGYMDNGFSELSALRESFNYGNVSATTVDTATYSDQLDVGGIAGYADGSMISDVYNRGKLEAKGKLAYGDSYVGGILGIQRYEAYHIKNSYSASAEMKGGVVGGVVGHLLDAGAPLNTYFDVNLSPVEGIGLDYFEKDYPELKKTTAELKSTQMVTLLNTEDGTVADRGLWILREDYPVFEFDTLYKHLQDEPEEHTTLVAPQNVLSLMSVQVNERTVSVTNIEKTVMVFDLHGHLVKSARCQGGVTNLTVPRAGRYIVRSGKQTKIVSVR